MGNCKRLYADTLTFYRQELPLRELRGCPPFRDLITVTFHGRVEEQTWQTAQRFVLLGTSTISAPQSTHFTVV